MKRKNLILALFCIVLLLSACGTGNDAKNGNSVELNQDTVNGNSVSDETEDHEASFEELIEATMLCDYSNIPVDASLKEVTDEDIDEEINNYLESTATYEHITEGVVEDGDTVGISFIGRMNGEEFEGGSGDYELTIGSGQFIPGFEEGLIGVEIGETTVLSLTFPEVYAEDLAGKDVEFDVTVNYKNGEKIVAELTDDFVKKQYGYESISEMRKYIKEYLEEDNAAQHENEVNDLVYRHIADNSKIPAIPLPLVEEYVKDAKNYYLGYAEQYGIEGDDYIEQLTGLSEEDFNSQMQEAGIEYYNKELIMQALVKDMGITVSDEEYDTYLEEQASLYGYESKEALQEELEANGVVEEFRKELLYDKIMEQLKNNII